MALLKEPFDDCIEKNISWIKRHVRYGIQVAEKYTTKELGQICDYLGLPLIKGEREKEMVVRLMDAINHKIISYDQNLKAVKVG